jgi:hypothetical protein
LFSLVFDAKPEGAKVRIRSGWRSKRPDFIPMTMTEVTEEGEIDLPEGAQLEVVYAGWMSRRRDAELIGTSISPVRVPTEYRTLWEGHLVKNGQTLKRIVYAARVAPPDEPPETLWPPATPAPRKGDPTPLPPEFTFQGVKLTNERKLSDPRVLHDLQISWRNNAIRSEGGTPTDQNDIEVKFKSKRDEAGREFLLFYDRIAKFWYVQVGVYSPLPPKLFWYGPYPDDVFKPTDAPGAETSPARGK